MGQCWCCHHDTSHCESSTGSSDECRPAPSGCRPLDQANRPVLRGRTQTQTISIYYYSVRKLILILPSHGGWVKLGTQHATLYNIGVRNLPKVFTCQRPGRESNLASTMRYSPTLYQATVNSANLRFWYSPKAYKCKRFKCNIVWTVDYGVKD